MGQKWAPSFNAESIAMLEAIGKYEITQPPRINFSEPAGLNSPLGKTSFSIGVFSPKQFGDEDLRNVMHAWETLRDHQTEIWETLFFRLQEMREAIADPDVQAGLCGEYVDDPSQPFDEWMKQHVKSSAITLGSVKGHVSGTLYLEADWDEEHGFELELDRWLGGEYDPIFE